MRMERLYYAWSLDKNEWHSLVIIMFFYGQITAVGVLKKECMILILFKHLISNGIVCGL